MIGNARSPTGEARKVHQPERTARPVMWREGADGVVGSAKNVVWVCAVVQLAPEALQVDAPAGEAPIF